MLSVTEIVSTGEFQSCRAQWEGLLAGSGSYSPFLSHDWFRCCLAGYGQGKELCILFVSEGPELLGIAPFWRYRDTVRGIPIRRMAFIISPDAPFVDFIIKRDRVDEVLSTIQGHLYGASRGGWDVLTLLQWPIESATCNAFSEILKKGHKSVSIGTSSKTPYVLRRSDWEKFFQSRSSRFRKTRRNILNRMARLRDVQVECVRRDATGSALREIVALSEKSWKHRDGVSIASRESGKRFFELLTEVAGQQGWLLVWLLRIGQAVVAMEYDLEYQGAVYALRADFDEAYEEYSPGAYLEYQVIKYVFDQGYAEYNTGPGLNAYKLHWTDTFKDNGALQVYNGNLKSRTIALLEGRVLPALRRLRSVSSTSGLNV